MILRHQTWFVLISLSLVLGCSKPLFDLVDGSSNETAQPGTTDPGEPTDNPSASIVEMYERMPSRNSVASHFNEIYGAQAATNARDLLQRQHAYFGGACSIYSGTATAPDLDCAGNRPMQQNASSMNNSTTTQGYLVRFCYAINSNTAAINYALDHIGAVSSTTPTANQALLMFKVFHPGQEPTPQLMSSLNDLVARVRSVETNNLWAWRYLLLALCMSPASWTP